MCQCDDTCFIVGVVRENNFNTISMNTTSSPSLSSAHYEAHKNFIGGVDTFDCSYIMYITDINERCHFSKHPECHENDGFFDYVSFFFCDVPKNYGGNSLFFAYLCLVAISLVCLVLLIINSFASFAHNVITIVYFLKIGDHGGGAIVVVFMNGAADILGRFLNYNEDAELVTNEMFGTGLLLMSFHAGLLITMFPFVIRPAFFLRDQIFFIATFTFLTAAIDNEPIHVIQGVVLMISYALFVATAVIHYVLARRRAKKEGDSDTPDDKPGLKKIGPLSVHFNEDLEFGEGSSRNDQIFKQFLRTLNPIKAHEMEGANRVKKILLFLVAPLRIPFILVLPCVNYTLPGHGWSKLINCINLVLTPFTFLGVHKIKVPWHYSCFCIPGLILAPIVFFTSRTDRPPKYHPIFAFYGAFGSICITYFLASELLAIWNLLATIGGLHPRYTYMTVFAWGSTIGDAVQNLTLASYGFSYMAFTAYLYSPMLNLIYSCGMILFLRYLEFKNVYIPFRGGDLGDTSTVFIYIVVIATTISVWLAEFQLRRSTGFFLIMLYLIYITYIGLTIIDFIHEYGTDHLVEIEAKKPDATWA